MMKTRSCRHLHFIAAIKSGSVTKLRNTYSCGNPALKLKSLKDIFESEDAKRISSNSAVEYNGVKTEPSYLPEVDRTLREIDLPNDDDSNLTLCQLKRIYGGKKRKLSSGCNLYAKQLYDNLQFGEDEFDLEEPLVHWKHKLTKKTQKLKRKSRVRRAIRSDPLLSVKLEPILDSEELGFANRELSLVCVKTEDPESEFFEFPRPISFIDAEPNFDTDIPHEVLEGHVFNNQALVLYGDGYQEYFPDPSEDIDIDGCDSFQQVLCIEECQNCSPDELSYDHLEPLPLPEISDGDNVYVSNEMMSCQPCVVSSAPESDTNFEFDYMNSGSTCEFVTPCKDQICHVSGSSKDSHALNETSGSSSSSSAIQALDKAVNIEVKIIDSFPPATQTKSSSSQQPVPSLDSHAGPSLDDESVSTNEGTAERDRSQDFSSTDTTKDRWSPRNCSTFNSPTTSDKECSEMASIDSNSVSSTRTSTFLDDHTLPAPVFQNSGRLTRKIIPPTSQERLCLTMSCEDLHNDADEYKCKEKLFSGEKTNSNPSIEVSNIETARRAENTAQPGQLNRRKVVINLGQNLQKEKNEKRVSSPKGNLEQPCYSRSLPCIDTGCTSVKSCSKGAIAFSQRQMNGMESLAGKLLDELKSMKDIVEQKLLLNSCRNLTLRNDADEVVAAIKTATRVEENAKRLLSVMTRDCNRFCKIMSLTRDGPSALENEVPRERRKIVFADEAGEMLCHVKYFENGSTSMCPLAEKPDN